jgi:hypothetical protein
MAAMAVLIVAGMAMAAGPEQKKQAAPPKAAQAQPVPKPQTPNQRSGRHGPRVWVYGWGSQPSEYWIGVECYPAPPAIQAQLRLEQSQGLVVVHVAADSPAAKAGLHEHDVLLKAGQKSLGDVHDLIEAVEASRQGKLQLDLVRDGKPMSLEVQPAKRPPTPEAAAEDIDVLRGWMERMMPGESPPPRFFVMRPGAILPPGVPVLPPLPDDTTVVITRHGNDPAKIVVEKGQQRWEATDQELNKLPAEVRPYVERMLQPYEAWPSMPRISPTQPMPDAALRRLAEQNQKHMAEMQRQLERLQKSLEELHQQRK